MPPFLPILKERKRTAHEKIQLENQLTEALKGLCTSLVNHPKMIEYVYRHMVDSHLELGRGSRDLYFVAVQEDAFEELLFEQPVQNPFKLLGLIDLKINRPVKFTSPSRNKLEKE